MSGNWGDCGPDCVMHDDAWTRDDTMKVTHHYKDETEISIAMKLYVIMSSSLLLIGLMVTCLGIKFF